MLPAQFGSIWPSSFRGEFFLTLANKKQELPLAAIFKDLMEDYQNIEHDRHLVRNVKSTYFSPFLAHLTQRVM
jgi:hypothetical protein